MTDLNDSSPGAPGDMPNLFPDPRPQLQELCTLLAASGQLDQAAVTAFEDELEKISCSNMVALFVLSCQVIAMLDMAIEKGGMVESYGVKA